MIIRQNEKITAIKSIDLEVLISDMNNEIAKDVGQSINDVIPSKPDTTKTNHELYIYHKHTPIEYIIIHPKYDINDCSILSIYLKKIETKYTLYIYGVKEITLLRYLLKYFEMDFEFDLKDTPTTHILESLDGTPTKIENETIDIFDKFRPIIESAINQTNHDNPSEHHMYELYSSKDGKKIHVNVAKVVGGCSFDADIPPNAIQPLIQGLMPKEQPKSSHCHKCGTPLMYIGNPPKYCLPCAVSQRPE